MKKSYVKPQVYFEDFQLSASIAGNCAPQYKNNQNVTFKSIDSCGYSFFGKVLFNRGEVCESTPPDDDSSPCYDNPNDANRLFAS